jgi:hypothetical protein
LLSAFGHFRSPYGQRGCALAGFALNLQLEINQSFPLVCVAWHTGAYGVGQSRDAALAKRSAPKTQHYEITEADLIRVIKAKARSRHVGEPARRPTQGSSVERHHCVVGKLDTKRSISISNDRVQKHKILTVF